MRNTLAEQTYTPWFHSPMLRSEYSPESNPEFTAPNPTTGTEDDDDEPEDEHPGENEAAERATNDATEAPEEFGVDDEDG
jgi:hypothetical protein